ncbi:MAG TPA: TA system VapC family ribonuclease toxin [Terriglobales bacterium]|nr:TA system VapC family ribonuclease toxin [Terriglobales bacterium]
MIVPDVNLLVDAYDGDSEFHSAARSWWEACLSGHETVALLPAVALGFVRLTTNPRVLGRCLRLAQALALVRSWQARPVVELPEFGAAQLATVFGVLEQLGAGGNLVTDAQIAAAALELKGVVHTADSDFLRFPGVRWFNPITGARGGRGLRTV